MKFRVLMLFIIIVLTACGPTALEAATPLSPTMPIRLSPSETQQPSVTPTFTPSLTPTPGVSPLLPILEANCFNDYPPPIELPNGNVKDYQIKSWTVEEALRLIRTIDQNSPPCNQNWTGSLAVYSAQNLRRNAAQLAVKEAILRYPNTPDRYLLDWRAALNNALLNSSSSDEWLLTRLSQALNEGRATPETLANFVLLYSFEIVQVEAVPDLFGDSTTGYVYWLSARAGSGDGLYFAVHQGQDKTYTLYPLLGFWALTGSVGGGFSIADHTKDAIPEITVYKAFRNGSFCWDELNVYQWNKERFENLTVQGIKSGIDGCETDFGEPDSNGFDTIKMVDSRPGAGYTDVHEWNGQFYELVNRIPFSGANTDWGLDEYINIFISERKFPEAENLIKQSIAGIQDIDISQGLKYNFLDYLHFQLGWVKALELDAGQAKEIFASLAASPTEPKDTIVSRAAQDFLKNYSSENDLYRACLAANRRMSQKTDASICDLSIALLSLSKSWTVDQYKDPLTTLDKYGVEIHSTLRDDIDGDGIEDWILIIQAPLRDRVDLYLWRIADKDSSLAYLAETSEPFKGSAIRLPGSERHTVFIQSGRSAYIFQVVPGNHRLNVYFLYRFHDVQDLELFKDLPEPFDFKITYFPDEYTPDWEIYRWDKGFQQFKLMEDHRSSAQSRLDGPVEAARLAEAKILIERNPLDAIPLLKKVLALPKGQYEGESWPYSVDRSRLRYLLALSYELTDDPARALQTYWKLWHDDPGSAYAVLARAKLEPAP